MPIPRITGLETLRHPAEPSLLHVRVADEAGGIGTGETHGHPAAVEALIAEYAPALSGLPAMPEAVAAVVQRGPYGGLRGGGHVSVESRAASALSLALYDLAARRAERPLLELLGGARPAAVTPYTTCCDADAEAALADPAGLARAVAADGFALLKVWPFVPGGDHATTATAVAALCGHGVAVAVDLYGVLEDAEAAAACRLLEPLGLAWIEDPVVDGRYELLVTLAAELSTPLCSGERLAGADAFAALLATGIAIVHIDVAWCGGLFDAQRVAALAGASGRSVALHDVSGPIAWAASLHLAQALDVPSHVECARVAVRGRYREIVDGLPDPAAGVPPPGVGHGLALKPGYVAGAGRVAHV